MVGTASGYVGGKMSRSDLATHTPCLATHTAQAQEPVVVVVAEHAPALRAGCVLRSQAKPACVTAQGQVRQQGPGILEIGRILVRPHLG